MIFETICALLSQQLGFDEGEIKLETSLADDLEISNADLEEILILLTQEFEITRSESDLNRIETVADLVSLIESRL